MSPAAPKHTHRGAIGGAANEDGADFRASVAAWAVAFGLAGRSPPCIDLPSAIPISVSFETDKAVDDVEVVLKEGGRILIQCKLSVNITERDKELRSVVAQWCRALQNGDVDPFHPGRLGRDILNLNASAATHAIPVLASFFRFPEKKHQPRTKESLMRHLARQECISHA